MEKRIRAGAITAIMLFYSLLLVLVPIYSSGQQMSIRIYTAKDGLPSSYIYGASQDKHGYLWVGSPEGLSRFDGKSFINYGVSDGLPDIRVVGMMIDSNNRHWAVTTRGAVEFKGGKFISYPFQMDKRCVGSLLFLKPGKARPGH